MFKLLDKITTLSYDSLYNFINLFMNDLEECICIKDINGKYISVNDSFCQLLGKKNNCEVINKTSRDFLDYDSNMKAEKNDKKAFANKEKSIVVEKIKINNNTIFTKVHRIPIMDNNEECYSLIIIRQIVQLHNKTHNIDFNNNYTILYPQYSLSNPINEIYEYIADIYKNLNLSGISLWIYDHTKKQLKKDYALGISELIPKNISLDANYSAEEVILECSTFNNSCRLAEDYLCNNYNILKHPYHKTMFKNKYMTIYPIVYSHNLLGLITVYFTKNNFNSTVNNYINNIVKRLILSLDNLYLTNSLKKELEVKEEIEKEFEYFLNIYTDLYIITNDYGVIKKVSNSFLKLLGWSNEDVKNKKLNLLLSPFYKNTLPSISEIKEKCNDAHIYCNILAKDNSKKLIELSYSYDKNTEQIFIIGKNMDELLTLQNRINLETHKSEFLANMSHDFKTPLNIIISASQLILEKFENDTSTINSKYFNYLESIKYNSYRLLRLINNLIDVTKLEDGAIHLYKENVNAVYFLESIVTSISDYIHTLGKNIIFDTDEEEVDLCCDPEKIERVILNLISNSLKYTSDNGIINITISTDWNNKRLYVSVKDNGIGISKENSNDIFKRFSQINNEITKSNKGSGLGLNIVKSIIEMHNGEIYLNESYTEGTEFIFYLPIRKCNNKEINSNSKSIDSRVERFNIELSDIYKFN